VRLKFAPKSENKTYDHFTPISGQASALNSDFCRSLVFYDWLGKLWRGFMSKKNLSDEKTDGADFDKTKD